MYFKEITGQEEVKQRLIREVNEGRIPHARLICGPEGTGKLPLAIAYARYIACSNRGETDACGACPSCVKYDKLAHPDLHFVFPVVRQKPSREPVSDDYIAQWRDMVLHTSYFNLNHWLSKIEAGNSQAMIYTKESDEITRKLSLKSNQGGYKIMIIWLPERMNITCANKLLKLLEEPPAQTLFLLVSEKPDMLLQTILSRTQRLNVKNLKEKEVADTLMRKYGLAEQDATTVAHLANGSLIKAIETIHLNEENKLFFDLFVNLMRLSYQRKLKEMKQWSEQVAAMGRERQKNLLGYCQRMIRENFVLNFRNRDMVYLNNDEMNFSVKFAPFVNERNVVGIIHELSEAQRHVEQNVNPKMIFFDFALKMIVLLKQ